MFTGLKSYINNTESCLASNGNPCSLAPQKTGTLDLGTYCRLVGAASQPCPESGLATNGDGATQATYAAGQIWFAVSTMISQKFGTASEFHMGAAYYVISTKSFTGVSPTLSLTSQGYVAAAHEDLEFPALIGGSGAARSRHVLHALREWRPDGCGPWRVLPQQRLRSRDGNLGGNRGTGHPHHGARRGASGRLLRVPALPHCLRHPAALG